MAAGQVQAGRHIAGVGKQEADETLRHELLQATALVAEQRSRAAKLNHDVRTPMGTIMGLTHVMARTSLSSDQRALLGKIDAAAQSLLQLIDDARKTEGSKDDGSVVVIPGPCQSPARPVDVSVTSSGHDDQLVLPRTRVDPVVVARLAGVRLLVADDSLSFLEVARQCLEREGARITAVLDGSQAVALLKATPCAFDAVLMDVQMPVMDGVAATRLIRGGLGLSHIPVIGMTGGAESGALRHALDAGMNSIISKPFQPDAVVVLLGRQLAPARSLPPPFPQVPLDGAFLTDWPIIEGIDGPDVQLRLGGDLAFFTRLVRSLCTEFADLAIPCAYPRSAQAKAAIADRLHKLGGNAGLVGASALRKAAATGEAAMRADPGCANARAALDDVRSSMHQLLRASAPWLTHSKRSDQGDPAPAAFDAELLAQWQAQLKSRDFIALTRFQELSPGLRLACGKARFEMLESAMEKLDFDSALALVGNLET